MRKLNLPTWLTLGRIGLTPVIVLLLHFPNKGFCLFAAMLYALAALSDYIDGRLARSYGQVTRVGKFLDPLADKVLNCSTMIMLVFLGWAPAWVVIVIVAREIAITGLRAIAADEGCVMAAERLGKFKTVLQSVALVPLVLHHPWFGINLAPLGLWLLYAALILTIYSGLKYTYDFYVFWAGRQAGDTSVGDAHG